MLDACRQSRNADLIDLVELALFTGMRRGELLELDWERVDRARGMVLLEVTKSGRGREVPLNSRAAESDNHINSGRVVGVKIYSPAPGPSPRSGRT